MLDRALAFYIDTQLVNTIKYKQLFKFVHKKRCISISISSFSNYHSVYTHSVAHKSNLLCRDPQPKQQQNLKFYTIPFIKNRTETKSEVVLKDFNPEFTRSYPNLTCKKELQKLLKYLSNFKISLNSKYSSSVQHEFHFWCFG